MFWWIEQSFNILQLSLVTSKFCPSNPYSTNHSLHPLPPRIMVQRKMGKWDVSNIRFLSFRGLIFHETMMGVSLNGGTPKSSFFNRVFLYKPSILGYHYFRKPPDCGRSRVNWPKFFPAEFGVGFARGDDGVLPRLATGATRVTYPKSLGQPGRGFLDSAKKCRRFVLDLDVPTGS